MRAFPARSPKTAVFSRISQEILKFPLGFEKFKRKRRNPEDFAQQKVEETAKNARNPEKPEEIPRNPEKTEENPTKPEENPKKPEEIPKKPEEFQQKIWETIENLRKNDEKSKKSREFRAKDEENGTFFSEIPIFPADSSKNQKKHEKSWKKPEKGEFSLSFSLFLTNFPGRAGRTRETGHIRAEIRGFLRVFPGKLPRFSLGGGDFPCFPVVLPQISRGKQSEFHGFYQKNSDFLIFSKELVYDYIANGKVAKIVIKRQDTGKNFSTNALVFLKNNEIHRIILSNSPHFIRSLEAAQAEMVISLSFYAKFRDFFENRAEILRNSCQSSSNTR